MAVVPTPTPATTGPGFNRVDGDFAGTTDQIIQWAACKWGIDEDMWAACKWGIDEDIVRAQIIKESYWYQSVNGDNGESFGPRPGARPPPTSRRSSTRSTPAPHRRTTSTTPTPRGGPATRAPTPGSTTVERNGTYAAGDVWGCIGVWFSGRWYINNDAYLNQSGDSVHWHYNNKTWLTSTFING